MTSFSQLCCHSNEVWQIGQIGGKDDSDLCSLRAVLSISAAISDRMTADHAVDPDRPDDGKTSLQQFFFLFIGFCAWFLSDWRQGSFHAHLMSFIFLMWQQSRPGEDIPTSPSCTVAMVDSVVQQWSASSSSLCHCWHLQSLCYRVCVVLVGGLLQCHPSKPCVRFVICSSAKVCKAGFGMYPRTNCMVHGYKVQLMPDVKWMASEKAQLLVDICISYGPWRSLPPAVK